LFLVSPLPFNTSIHYKNPIKKLNNKNSKKYESKKFIYNVPKNRTLQKMNEKQIRRAKILTS